MQTARSKQLIAFLLLLFLLAACRTQRDSERRAEPAEEMPEASMEQVPEPPVTVAGELPSVGLPSIAYSGEQPVTAEAIVAARLATLSLRQKIGQRFLTGVPGTRMSKKVRTLIEKGSIGGVMLTRTNIESRKQLKSFTAELQEAARALEPQLGLLIAIDQEGGRVNRLDLDNLTRFAAPYYWAEYQDPHYIEAVAYITAREALSLGCNINLAPVLDLYAAPDQTVVGDRSMGFNAVQVGERGVYYLSGARRAGMAAVVKHFPGHGRTAVDSHFRLPVVDVKESVLINEDLIPFQMAIQHGVDAIMTAHILYPQIDAEYPVTLSAKFITGLLRERLGFQGVIISDDIEMGALRGRFSTRVILKQALSAGVDIILAYGTLDVLQLIEEVHSLVEAGEVSTEAIDQGVARILMLKLKYGLL